MGYDLGFDGSHTSFTASELGIYVVTGTSAVPIPGGGLVFWNRTSENCGPEKKIQSINKTRPDFDLVRAAVPVPGK